MPNASTAYLNLKFGLARLTEISNNIASYDQVFMSLKELSDQGILDSTIKQAVITEMKSDLNNMVNAQLSKVKNDAEILAMASQVEIYSNLKGIAPVIASIPVIAPLPEVFAASNVATLLQLETVVDQITQITNDLKKVLN